MNKKYAIFDMDGTLVDSMVYWQCLAREFLERKGVTQVSEELMETIAPMTMTESAALFIQEFGLCGTPLEVANEMNAMMDEHYCSDILLKAGVREYVEHLHGQGVRMCVASATAEHLMQACLGRLGILPYFEFLLSCETVGAGKQKPDIYVVATERMKSVPSETAVYEDALYAAKTAKKAGFYVIGVYDESAKKRWREMRELADETIENWTEVTCR